MTPYILVLEYLHLKSHADSILYTDKSGTKLTSADGNHTRR